MDEHDLELRRRTYAFFVEHGRAPVAPELGGVPRPGRRALVVRQLRVGRVRDLRGPGRRRPHRDVLPRLRRPLAIELLGGRPDDDTLLFHCLVPARRWWDDRISPDWTPHTREQNVAILDRLGLTGEFWQLA